MIIENAGVHVVYITTNEGGDVDPNEDVERHVAGVAVVLPKQNLNEMAQRRAAFEKNHRGQKLENKCCAQNTRYVPGAQ
jgi:hypothetical protein